MLLLLVEYNDVRLRLRLFYATLRMKYIIAVIATIKDPRG